MAAAAVKEVERQRLAQESSPSRAPTQSGLGSGVSRSAAGAETWPAVRGPQAKTVLAEGRKTQRREIVWVPGRSSRAAYECSSCKRTLKGDRWQCDVWKLGLCKTRGDYCFDFYEREGRAQRSRRVRLLPVGSGWPRASPGGWPAMTA